MTRIMICGHRWTSHKGKASLTSCAITLAFQDTRLPPRPHHLFQLSLPRDAHGKLTTSANRAVCKEVDPASAVLHQWIRSLIGALVPDPVDAELNLPAIVLEMFETYRGNAMVGVPTMLIAMLEHPTFPTTDLSSVKAICSGGSNGACAIGEAVRGKAGCPLHHRFRSNRMFPFRGANPHQ
jgi:hypothetical protein